MVEFIAQYKVKADAISVRLPRSYQRVAVCEITLFVHIAKELGR